MVMTEAEWNALMNRLPPEDRSSYQDYLGVAEPAPEPVPTEPTWSFTDYWADSADYWMAMGDKYAADAAAAAAAADAYTAPESPYTPVEPPPNNPPYFPTKPYVPPYFPTTPYVPPYNPPYVAPYIAPKVATPQYVIFKDDQVPVNTMFDLLFEDIGGQELLSIVRSDTVNGQKIAYQPIKNLGILQEEYNPNNLIRLQNTSDKFFANYTIKLSDRIPTEGNGLNGDNVYLDSSGNLVIEFINLENDEQAEVQITLNGTIYEAGI